MSSEKTEKPTSKKKRDAARRGQSFKSRDLVVAFLTLCAVVYLMTCVSFFEIMGVFQRVITHEFRQNIDNYTKEILWLCFKLIVPFIVLCVFVSALPALFQSGFTLATEALKLNLSAVNPISGFKKLFRLRTVKDTIKSLLYLACFFLSVIIFWLHNKNKIFSQLNTSVLGLIPIWKSLLLDLVWTWLGCIVLILLLDALAEFFLYLKELKMDKQEVKQEWKEQEGSPEVKSRRRELQHELLSEQVKSDVENSSFILANPTHIAIGIYFKPEILPIPFISLLETNQRALAVRAYAEQVGVPIVRDIPLARRVYKTHKRYTFVSLDEIDAVMRVLTWLYEVENSALQHDATQDETGGSAPVEQG